MPAPVRIYVQRDDSYNQPSVDSVCIRSKAVLHEYVPSRLLPMEENETTPESAVGVSTQLAVTFKARAESSLLQQLRRQSWDIDGDHKVSILSLRWPLQGLYDLPAN